MLVLLYIGQVPHFLLVKSPSCHPKKLKSAFPPLSSTTLHTHFYHLAACYRVTCEIPMVSAKSHFPSPRSASRDPSTCTRPVHQPPRSPGGHTRPTPDGAGRPGRRGIDHATTMRRRAVPTSAVQNRWISATQKDGEKRWGEFYGRKCGI